MCYACYNTVWYQLELWADGWVMQGMLAIEYEVIRQAYAYLGNSAALEPGDITNAEANKIRLFYNIAYEEVILLPGFPRHNHEVSAIATTEGYYIVPHDCAVIEAVTLHDDIDMVRLSYDIKNNQLTLRDFSADGGLPKIDMHYISTGLKDTRATFISTCAMVLAAHASIGIKGAFDAALYRKNADDQIRRMTNLLSSEVKPVFLRPTAQLWG